MSGTPSAAKNPGETDAELRPRIFFAVGARTCPRPRTGSRDRTLPASRHGTAGADARRGPRPAAPAMRRTHFAVEAEDLLRRPAVRHHRHVHASTLRVSKPVLRRLQREQRRRAACRRRPAARTTRQSASRRTARSRRFVPPVIAHAAARQAEAVRRVGRRQPRHERQQHRRDERQRRRRPRAGSSRPSDRARAPRSARRSAPAPPPSAAR